MSYSVEELMEVTYLYYPRGIDASEAQYKFTEEDRRLVSARQRAVEDYDTWREMLHRLKAQFPGCEVYDKALHLLSSSFGACYSGTLSLPTSQSHMEFHALEFLVSFLVPYYTIYRHKSFSIPGTACSSSLSYHSEHDWNTPDEMSFELSAEEEPYARSLAAEIEATFVGYASMLPELGKELVPDINLGIPLPGKATLYDCLFTESW